jgi:hypothetical protein
MRLPGARPELTLFASSLNKVAAGHGVGRPLGMVVVELPPAIKALLEALPDPGVLPLNGSATVKISSDVAERRDTDAIEHCSTFYILCLLSKMLCADARKHGHRRGTQ